MNRFLDPHQLGTLRSRNRRRAVNRLFMVFCIAVAALSLVVLAVLLISILSDGHHHLDGEFLQNANSRKPENAGIWPAMVGSILVCGVCALMAIPLGVGTAILLEEFQPKRKWSRKLHAFVQLNITNLAGVPSVVYGILGLTVFVDMFGLFGTYQAPSLELGDPSTWFYLRLPLGAGVLAGGLTLGLVVLPVVIVSTQEALRAVPDSLRQGALALGASPWQTVWSTTLPAAIPGIMTGVILSMSRAIGEAAPILIVSGIAFIDYTPNHLMDDFTVMPLQIYNWAGDHREEYHRVAATGIIVLLSILLMFNAVAIYLRQKYQRPLK
ncbi:MAG: phosphate ABC transporter permease PstA [Phycisphaeraceae bacterium]|nr:phosphate ABC transporter permease PstA [Phycisphaeraceae bacterium]